jgi:hypothetical protein
VADINTLSPEYLSKAADFYQLMMETNPDIAEKSKDLALQANPKLRLPEVTLRRQIEAQDKKFADMEEKMQRQEIDRRNAERERAAAAKIKESGFTAEEIEKIVKDQDLRGEKMIDTAIRLAQLERQQADPGPGVMAHGSASAGPRDLRPDLELRKMNLGQQREWAHNQFRDGIADILRRQRNGGR